MKFIILLLLLGFACAVAMMLIRRLHTIASDLGDLRRDMARNESELRRRVAVAEQNKKDRED